MPPSRMRLTLPHKATRFSTDPGENRACTVTVTFGLHVCFYACLIGCDCVGVSKSECGLESFGTLFVIRTHLLLLCTFHDLDNSFHCFVYCSNVFKEVQENSYQIWICQYYDVVVEYSKRPPLAPPFAILCHIVEFVR